MATGSDKLSHEEAGSKPEVYDHDNASGEVVGVVTEEKIQYEDSRKLGITGAVFLILNKMIGTGIFSTPSSIFAATGSVGISLMLWVVGMTPHLSSFLFDGLRDSNKTA